ncbi:MAG TPA: hypothetical protein VD833_03645 [Vicinamibacterales bacterium]|nr:hypothetical protein [Vicinamibacterales bacterium]
MTTRTWLPAWAIVASATILQAHDGPPFPILSNLVAGPYQISVWTDPDTTDDGTPGGQFWVRVHRADGVDVPHGTRATVAIRPMGGPGSVRTASASPVRGDVSNQFAALVMDHEGRFAVLVDIDGPLGPAAIEGAVDATYDLRPAPLLLLLYLAPFVMVGLLWGRLIVRRRANPGRSGDRSTRPRMGAGLRMRA